MQADIFTALHVSKVKANTWVVLMRKTGMPKIYPVQGVK